MASNYKNRFTSDTEKSKSRANLSTQEIFTQLQAEQLIETLLKNLTSVSGDSAYQIFLRLNMSSTPGSRAHIVPTQIGSGTLPYFNLGLANFIS